MHQVVMPAAQQQAVVEVGGSLVAFPPLDVVDVAPGGGPVTRGTPAMAVAGHDRPALASGPVALLAPEVQRHRVRVDQQP